jgi:transcriptional regulator with XRE-family HTH domain
MYYDMKKSGARIRQLRTKSGLTQEKTAEALNVDRSFYCRIESGKKGCSVDLFIQLSELFQVSLDYLILGKYPGAVPEGTDTIQLKKDITDMMTCLEQLKAIL